MAVQAVKALGGATSSAITTTTGATLFACFSGGDGGVYAPSDSKGNSWGSPVVNVTGGGARLAIYIVQNATVGSGHTFQFSGANGDTVGLFGEVSGVLAASLDAAATAGGQGAEPFTLNAASALAQADNTILAFMFPYASGDPINYTANTGYTIHAQENNNNVYYGSAVASKVVSSTSAPSVQWDMTTSGDIFAGILALKMSGGGGGGIDGAGNIATGQAVGVPTVGGGVVAAGIPSAAAVGAPSLSAGISAAGIPTGEAVGQPVVAGTGVFAAGIPSAAAVGQPALGAAIVAAGIASSEAVGNPTIGAAPEPPASSAGGFEMGGGRQVREVYRKPLLQRILDARYPRVKPRGERAQKRAKAIENEGADLVLEGSPTFADLEELAAQWMAQGPVMPSVAVDPLAVYLAQVAFRLRQRQAEIEAAALRQRQDEEAILVLLLA